MMQRYQTPEGIITARIYERYEGLYHQMRVGLVDEQGRVHHYDTTDIQPGADVMYVVYDSPNVGFGVEKEIPCEADPMPFALEMIETVRKYQRSDLDTDTELHYCYADGAPLK